MSKKREDEPSPGSPAWMATFSDMMNLLLCFFVLLFSMSTISEEKLQEVIASFNNTFSIFDGGASSIGDGVLVSNGVSQLNELSTYINSTGTTSDTDEPTEDLYTDPDSSVASDGKELSKSELIEEIEELKISETEKMAEEIEEMLEESGIERKVDVDFTSQYVQLTVKGSFLFDSGSAALRKEAYDTLQKAGDILESYSNCLIEIEGHTDTVPMSGNGKYSNNDELSSGRALAVFNFLIDNTFLDPAMMKHSGRGEYVPVADNSTVEGRSKNRRVEIKIYNTLSTY